MSGENDVTKGNKIIHAGTAYGGKNQHHPNVVENEESIHWRGIKFKPKIPPRDNPKVELNSGSKAKTKTTPINLEKVRWAKVNNEPPVLLDCRYAISILKDKNELSRPTKDIKSLYWCFMSTIGGIISHKPKLKLETPLRLLAAGKDPNGKKGLGGFIKVAVFNREFILPDSFFKDCKKAISKSNP